MLSAQRNITWRGIATHQHEAEKRLFREKAIIVFVELSFAATQNSHQQ